jgi:hypothetical protein
MKFVLSTVLSVLMLFSMAGCGFTGEVRDEAATIIPMANAQLTSSSIVINTYKSLLEAYKKVAIAEALKKDPNLDPEKIVVVIEVEDGKGGIDEIPVDDIIANLTKMVDDNMQVAEALDLLNESIQANQGLNPLVGEIKNLAKDPEFQKLVKAYWDMLRKKGTGG